MIMYKCDDLYNVEKLSPGFTAVTLTFLLFVPHLSQQVSHSILTGTTSCFHFFLARLSLHNCIATPLLLHNSHEFCFFGVLGLFLVLCLVSAFVTLFAWTA